MLQEIAVPPQDRELADVDIRNSISMQPIREIPNSEIVLRPGDIWGIQVILSTQ